ncbi:DUF2092 domain-containing protein [Pedosphaera parvula]|uniref:DUF2092 domain-containing protein n=1 Tax=Pedosphaera parvula (strain Ellin514) TaxID=320771 RepID=B9XRI7_PEDPL|nr:DUF2092 domain-containing protein [Pedosphaera parvula]EEF57558.1 conserved hypothetical protein [Pedosphaera parvula Ellin514]
MKVKRTFFAALCSLAIIGSVIAVDNPAPTIHPEAGRILRQSSDRLATAKTVSFHAEVWEDSVVETHKVSATSTVDVRLRRPDKFQIEVHSPTRSRGYWYDGHTLTLFDRTKNLYSTVTLPGTIDKAIDAAKKQYDINIPLGDFLVNDPFTSAMGGTKGGANFGQAAILGTPCQHIAFNNDQLDWQLWIATDAQELPRKLVITYKQEPLQPQVLTLFNNWKLNEDMPDSIFVFTPPKGAAKIEMLPASAPNNRPPSNP